MPRGTSQYDAAIIERRLWTPQLVSTNCWYDASDYSTLVWDARITTWKDKSGKGNDLNQASVSAQPDWVENTFNNKPSVYFDGVNDKIVVSTAITWTTQHTFLWAGTIVESPTASSAFFHADGTNGGPNNYLSGLHWFVDGVGDILQIQNFVDNNPLLLTVSRNSATWIAKKNGGDLSGLAGGTSNTATFKDFGTSYSDYSNMRLAEFFMFPTALESWIIQKAEGLLAYKWNMVNDLNSSHQYKNKPPLRDAG